MPMSLGGDDVLYRGNACFDWYLSTTLERALLNYLNISILVCQEAVDDGKAH